jgi:hypothetical protein
LPIAENVMAQAASRISSTECPSASATVEVAIRIAVPILHVDASHFPKNFSLSASPSFRSA